jgi:hypothetical protein
MKKIMQLIPAAPGWFATYNDDGNRIEAPVAAWALMEDDFGDRWIEGVDPAASGWGGSTVGDAGNFVEYTHRD